jgi:hypothetical protein
LVGRRPGRGNEQIGLAAEEGRNLQNIDDFGDGRALIWFVHVGEDRDTKLVA